MSAEWELQKAIYGALRGDTAVLGLVNDVYDHVPQGLDSDEDFPYIVVGDTTAVDQGTKSWHGQEHTIVLHIWSRYRGFMETKQIMAAIYAVLHENEALAVTGHEVWLLRYEFGDTFLDPDGITRHGVVRYRVRTKVA